MHTARIGRSLFVAAAAQGVFYLALWQTLALILPPPPELAALEGTPYQVTDARGDVHVMAVDSPDPAQPLLQATRLHGDDISLQQLTKDEAIDILKKQRSTHHWVFALFVFPIAFVLVGVRISRRGRTLEAVLDAITPTLTEQIAAVGRRTRINERSLRTEVERIRQLGIADLRWDDESGRIYDDRLPRTASRCSCARTAPSRSTRAFVPTSATSRVARTA